MLSFKNLISFCKKSVLITPLFLLCGFEIYDLPQVNIVSPADGSFYNSPQTITIDVEASDNDGNISHVDFYIDDVYLSTDLSAPYSTDWTIPSNGSFEIKATAYDNDGNDVSSVITIHVGSASLCRQVNVSSDDAEEDTSTSDVDLNSSDLELIFDGVDQVVGVRFTNLNIPQCAVINSAYVQFTAKGSNNNIDPCTLQIYGEASDDAATFSNDDGNISNRSKTNASASWSPPLWETSGESGPSQQTVDISPIVQEIVERVGFTSNSSIVLIFEGTGKRRANSFDGDVSAAPILCIEYDPIAPDDDNDGVCNANDQCPGGPEPGTPCDDGILETYNDVINLNCVCEGTPYDCPGLLANIGDPCDDGNPETSNDVINSNCICEGEYDCPGLQANIGDPCDDGNPETLNDVINSDCVCAGEYDCPGLQLNFGDPCDDGISGTYNDTIDNNCICVGIWECEDLMAGFGDLCDDGNPDTTSDAIDSTCNCVGYPFVSVRVLESDDDAEESITGEVDVSSSDLELVFDDTTQSVGVRFQNINIPQCAVIHRAYIQFTAKGSANVDPCMLYIYGEANDNAVTFDNVDFDISNRSKTSTIVVWSPPEWQSNGDSGSDQQTPDITSLIQEIVDRPGFSDTSSLAFIFDGIGTRRARSFEGDSLAAPLLFVEYNPIAPDDDGDGVCNANDLCPGGPEPGTPCDDANDLTYGDAIDSNCDCIGIPFDCPDLLLNIGDSCDDGDPDTPNDYVDDNCDCVGGFDCPDIFANFGDPCDDGISGTYDDMIDTSCVCVGIWECEDLMAGFGDPCDDENPNTADDIIDSTCVCVGTPFLFVKIAESSDDAEEKESGDVGLTSSDLELVDDGVNQTVGLRFTNLNIPHGAMIDTAYVQFTTDEVVNNNPCNLEISGEASDNAQTFLDENSNISSRPRTSAMVNWSPDDWLNDGDAGVSQRTNNLAAIIQEIVDRNGFNSNSAIVLIIEGTGTRTATSYDGDPEKAPELYLRYQLPLSTKSSHQKIQSKLKVYPVPAKEFLNISFKSESNTKIPIQIIDINGRLLFEDLKWAKKGENEMLIGGLELQNGIYFVQLYFDKSVHTAKFIIIR